MFGILGALVFVHGPDEFTSQVGGCSLTEFLGHQDDDDDDGDACLAEPSNMHFSIDDVSEKARHRVDEDHVERMLAILCRGDHALKCRAASIDADTRATAEYAVADPAGRLPAAPYATDIRLTL